MSPLTISDVVNNLRSELPNLPELTPPSYVPSNRVGNVALAVSSMKDHMTDEGWQIMLALQSQGYALWGKGCSNDSTDVRAVIATNPATCVVQDKREWDLTSPRDFRDPLARFNYIRELKKHPEIFTLTILKDSQARPAYHRESAWEIGCHAWIVYYHPTIVKALAPYVRERHLIRTYHTLDPKVVLPYSASRLATCLISGAVSGAYPLRVRLVNEIRRGTLNDVKYLSHPGYHRNGCHTPQFFRLLAQYKVAICTASRYGYALRKLIEATAAGCRVITDLPSDEVLPCIDGNLIRVHPNISISTMREIVREAIATYEPERQRHFAQQAIARYDYRVEGQRLTELIEEMRRTYP